VSEGRIKFDDFELDCDRYELLRAGRSLKLEKIPMELLILLVAKSGHLVTRSEIVERLWGNDVFVDTEHGINTAIRKIRQVLRDDPDQPRFVQTVTGKGYRFIAPLTWIRQASDNGGNILKTSLFAATEPRSEQAIGADAGKVSASVARAGVTKSYRLPRLRRLVLLALVASGIGVLAFRFRGPLPAPKVLGFIAVLPFANVSGDANSDYLSDGITESLIDNLARVPGLRLRPSNAVFRYKGKEVDVQKIGNDLGVSALVAGRVTPRGERIEVSIELTDVGENAVIWGQHYSGKNTDLLSLQQQIAGDVAERLYSKLSSSEKQQVTKQGTQNPQAYEMYLKGRYEWNKRTPSDIATAISYFSQAIAKDPAYALAYSGLADAFGVLPQYGGTFNENYLKSSAAARRALELDASLPHPHAVLGANEIEYDWDFVAGETEYKKAFELDPNDATAHQWYAQDLGAIGGREQEALAEINRAHQLDPFSPIISSVVGFVHIAARRYDEAIVTCKKVATENPTFAMAHSCLARAYLGKRMYAQGIEETKAYGQLSGDRNESDFASALEQGFRSAGWKGALTEGIKSRLAQRKTDHYSAFEIAELYADLGDKDKAFRWLNTAYREREGSLLELKTDYYLDPIRFDPRFAELLRKVGLPQ
jgi:TolB-like protein/DNA-binding winged helix-turn-helix (wHTH) protein